MDKISKDVYVKCVWMINVKNVDASDTYLIYSISTQAEFGKKKHWNIVMFILHEKKK